MSSSGGSRKDSWREEESKNGESQGGGGAGRRRGAGRLCAWGDVGGVAEFCLLLFPEFQVSKD